MLTGSPSNTPSNTPRVTSFSALAVGGMFDLLHSRSDSRPAVIVALLLRVGLRRSLEGHPVPRPPQLSRTPTGNIVVVHHSAGLNS
jgi:hypothetical protein